MILTMIFRCLLLFLAFEGFAQNTQLSKADSLRYCGFFSEELDIRQKTSPKTFDLRLAEANVFLQNEEAEKAFSILKTLKAITVSDRFWLNKTRAKYYRQAEEYDQALNILSTISPKENTLNAAILKLDKGQIYALKDEQLKAIRELEAAVQEFEKSGNKNHYMNGITLSDLAYAYDEVGIRNKTVYYSEKAVRLLLNHYPQDFAMVSTSHNNLLFYVIEYGDEKIAFEVTESYRKYMEGFLAAKSKYRKPHNFSDFEAEGLYRLSLLRYYSFANDSPKILESIKALEQFYKRAPKAWTKDNLNILSQGYEEVQYSFRQQKKFKEALYYSRFIDKVQQKPYNIMKKHAAYALTYYDAKQNPEALKHVDLCLQSFDFAKGSRSLQTLMVLKAELLSRLGRAEEAKKVLREIYDEVLEKPTPYLEIEIEHYPQHINKIFMNLLIHSGLVYQNIYEQKGKSYDDYKTAKHFNWLAGMVFEKYYQTGLYNSSLGELLDQIEDGLFYEPEKMSPKEILECSNLVEKISNIHLWRQFSSRYIQNLNLPTERLKVLNNLQLKRNLLGKSYELELKNHKEIGLIDKEISGIQSKLNKDFPEYSLLSSSAFAFERFQKKIKKDEAVLKFSLGLDKVYAHLITADKVELKELGGKVKIENLVNRYLESLKEIRSDYLFLQKELEKVLIKPLGLGNVSRMTMVTEGFLNTIPLETLLDKQVALSYGLSLKNLGFNTQKSRTYYRNLVGFVPAYTTTGNANFEELKYSVKELKSIEKQIGRTVVYEGEKADKATFLQTLGKYKIHHLSMHSEMDMQDYQESSLLFSKGDRVFFHELYALNFPSEMVVLSACNTGLGRYLNGEGVMSLARALNYAGVKSSLTSLWQIPDKESSELMELFYGFLSDGKPKDEALMLAKSTFTKKYPMKAHPYYWAGFILTGDISPLDLEDLPFGWIILGMVVSMVFWIWRGNRKVNSKFGKLIEQNGQISKEFRRIFQND